MSFVLQDTNRVSFPKLSHDHILTNWTRKVNNIKYNSIVDNVLSHLPVLNLNSVKNDPVLCQTTLDKYLSSLCEQLIVSAKEAGIVPR